MQYLLGKTTIHIEFPAHAVQNSNVGHYERSFSQILSMDSNDMAYGYIRRAKVVTKASKLHAKLIASVILSTLVNHYPGNQCTEHKILSWESLKNEKLWLKFGIQLKSKSIRRLDWLFHRLLVSNEDSVQRWINARSQWEAFPTEDQDADLSDLDFDDADKKVPTEVGLEGNPKLKKHQKSCNLC